MVHFGGAGGGGNQDAQDFKVFICEIQKQEDAI